jgi:hypothetical protein
VQSKSAGFNKLNWEKTSMIVNEEKCLHCERDSSQVPLLALRYRGQDLWICPQHLPILIHKPQQLADKLPGATFISDPESHPHG